MTGKLRILLTVLLVGVVNSECQALEPFLEPYIGVSKIEATRESTTDFTDPSFTNSVSKNQVVANGFHLGVRLGVILGKSYSVFGEYFQGGPYSEANVTNPSSFDSEEKLTNRMGGVGVGAQFDVIALSAAYFFKNSYDFEVTQDSGEKAVRVGLSLPVSKKQFIRANLDVFLHLLAEAETSTDNVTSVTTAKVSIATTAVSLSFPFDF